MTAARVLLAAFKALLLFVVSYVVAIHTIVVWRITTLYYAPPQTPPEPEIITKIVTETVTEEEVLSPTEKSQLEQLQEKTNQMRTIISSHRTVTKRKVSSERELLRQQMGRLDSVSGASVGDAPFAGRDLSILQEAVTFVEEGSDHRAGKTGSPHPLTIVKNAATAKVFRHNRGLSKLFHVLSRLSTVEKSTASLFTAAYSDLTAIRGEFPESEIEEQVFLWLHINEFFQSVKLDGINWTSSIPQPKCPTREALYAEGPPPGTYEVEDAAESIRDLLATREDQGNEWAVSLAATQANLTAHLEATVRQSVHRLKSMLPELPDSEYQRERKHGSAAGRKIRDCVNTMQVIPWLDAGLDAFYRQQDIRQAILDAVQEDSATPLDESSMILDAFSDLEYAEEMRGAYEHEAALRRQNLRQLLDQPLTKQASAWIDSMIDAVSGYNDQLDQLMDSVYREISKLEGYGGDAFRDVSVGQFVLEQVRQAAGKVDLPYLKDVQGQVGNVTAELVSHVKQFLTEAYERYA